MASHTCTAGSIALFGYVVAGLIGTFSILCFLSCIVNRRKCRTPLQYGEDVELQSSWAGQTLDEETFYAGETKMKHVPLMNRNKLRHYSTVTAPKTSSNAIEYQENRI